MKIRLTILAMALIPTITSSSCGELKEVGGFDPEPVKEAQPIALTKAEAEMTADANALGFNVFAALDEDEPGENRFISPLSLSLALSLTACGADGRTADQMVSTLGLEGYSRDEMGQFYRKMTDGLLKADPSTTFTIANAIWASKLIKMKAGFTSDAEKYFSSEVHTSDFDSKSTINDINSWCSKHTNGKITKILDELDGDLRMILLNALYFNGKWSTKFPDATDGRWTDIKGNISTLKMMSSTRSIRYTENSTFQIAELPYGNGAFVMDILLPKKNIPFSDAISAIDSKNWTEWMNSLYECEVTFKMPVFKMEYTVELSDVLKGLGMTDAFSGSADFSRMSDTGLCISFVRQKTYVDVNEKGTEAAAVTAIGMKYTSVGPDRTRNFIADRPFIFAIREKSTGAVIFLGQKTI